MDQPQNTETPESLALRLLAMINRNWTTQALYVTAELGLPDLLASGLQSSEHLAQATGVHAPSLPSAIVCRTPVAAWSAL